MLMNRNNIVQHVNYSPLFAQFATWDDFVAGVAIFAYQIVEKSFTCMLEQEDHNVYEQLSKQKLNIKTPDIPVSFEDYVSFFQKQENQISYYIAYSATKYVIRYLSDKNLRVADFISPHLSIGKLM